MLASWISTCNNLEIAFNRGSGLGDRGAEGSVGGDGRLANDSQLHVGGLARAGNGMSKSDK